jgi:hypothetical protein
MCKKTCSSEPKNERILSPQAEDTSSIELIHPMTTGSARARLAHGLKLDDLELSYPVLIGGSGSMALTYQTLPDTERLELHEVQAAIGGTCKGDLPLKTPQRGSGKSEQSQCGESGPDIGIITSLRQPPPAAPAKDGLGRFRSARLVALTSFGLIAGRCRF